MRNALPPWKKWGRVPQSQHHVDPWPSTPARSRAAASTTHAREKMTAARWPTQRL